MSQMGCSEVVQSYTFHKAKTRWRLVDWVLVAGQVVAREASKK
jgi:hypothetical protein